MVEEDNSVRGTQPRSLAEAVEEFLKEKGINPQLEETHMSDGPIGECLVGRNEGVVVVASRPPTELGGEDYIKEYESEWLNELYYDMVGVMKGIDKGQSPDYSPWS